LSRSIFSSGASNPAARYDRYTAVYDISARTVYMPDGSRLEAHSGLGSRLDDPRFVHERMHGATPPTSLTKTPSLTQSASRSGNVLALSIPAAASRPSSH
jgi:hypothetical protein